MLHFLNAAAGTTGDKTELEYWVQFFWHKPETAMHYEGKSLNAKAAVMHVEQYFLCNPIKILIEKNAITALVNLAGTDTFSAQALYETLLEMRAIQCLKDILHACPSLEQGFDLNPFLELLPEGSREDLSKERLYENIENPSQRLTAPQLPDTNQKNAWDLDTNGNFLEDDSDIEDADMSPAPPRQTTPILPSRSGDSTRNARRGPLEEVHSPRNVLSSN